MLRIAHISDLHFFNPHFTFSQFYSKEWLANLTLLLFRRKKFQEKLLSALQEILPKLRITHLIITGDLSSTSTENEFLRLDQFFSFFRRHKIKLLFLPGNHDCYTPKADLEKRFYQSFFNPNEYPDESFSHFSLKKDRVEAHNLNESDWFFILLDCAFPTSLLSSRGYFTLAIEKNLKNLLACLPLKANIIVANHFPLCSTVRRNKLLVRRKVLMDICQNDSRIKLYLNGHSHENQIHLDPKENLPILIESGAASHCHKGGFHIVTVENQKSLFIEAFYFKDHFWQLKSEQRILTR